MTLTALLTINLVYPKLGLARSGRPPISYSFAKFSAVPSHPKDTVLRVHFRFSRGQTERNRTYREEVCLPWSDPLPFLLKSGAQGSRRCEKPQSEVSGALKAGSVLKVRLKGKRSTDPRLPPFLHPPLHTQASDSGSHRYVGWEGLCSLRCHMAHPGQAGGFQQHSG